MPAALDSALLRAFRTRGHSPAAEAAAIAVSRFGEHGAGWIALALAGAALDGGRRPEYLRAARAAAVAYVANQALKLIVRRRRPQLEGAGPLLDTRLPLSYPSAHAATSFAAARALPGPVPRPLLYACAVAIAAGRPYLGVHWPSDVVAGAALGHAVAELMGPPTP